MGCQYDTQYELLRIYVHRGAPFCVLTVKQHCLPLTRLPRVAGGTTAVNHKDTAIWLALRILAANEHCNLCDGNPVSEYKFNFFMATYEWMHPKYGCRICKYLFCFHAKFYKHISPSHYEPDVQRLKFCCKCSIWFFAQFSIQGNPQIKWIQLSQYWSYRYNSFCILLWILFIWKPWEILMIFELFLDQILWRARNKWKFLTFYLKCAISRKILEVSKIWMMVFWQPFYQTSCIKKKMQSDQPFTSVNSWFKWS